MASNVIPAKKPAHSRAAAGEASPPRGGLDLTRLLRERIASQEIAPGAKLRENELAKEFGLPRTRVRETLAALEQRGLVERIPGRGAVVMRLDLSQVFHIYTVREVLEGLCARLATRNASASIWQHHLDEFKGPMLDLVRQGDLDAYTGKYEAFRRQLIVAADNPLLAEMLDSILEKTQVLIRRIIILPGRVEAGMSEHIATLEAMCRGDADEAERLRRANMRSAKAWLERYQKYVL